MESDKYCHQSSKSEGEHLKYFSDILLILGNTLVPFCFSSLVVTIVAVSLASTDFSRTPGKERLIWIAHFGPLFFVPIVVANTITKFAEHTFGQQMRQEILLLPIFGYLFHVGLAWFILESVFHWKDRIEKARKIVGNVYPPSFSATLLVYYFKCAWPIWFVFACVLAYQEAMISAPFFLDGSLQTVASYLLSKVGQNVEDKQRLTVAGLTLVTLLAPLLIAKLLDLGIGKTVSLLYNRIYRMPRHRGQKFLTWIRKRHIVRGVMSGIIWLSGAVCATVSLLVSIQLIREIVADFSKSPEINIWGIASPYQWGVYLFVGGFDFKGTVKVLSSLMSPGIICSAIGATLVISVIMLSIKEHRKSQPFGIRIIRSDQIGRIIPFFALVPPSIIAIIDLVFVFGTITKYVMGYASLIAYATISIVFFFPPSGLRQHVHLLSNANRMRLSFSRKLKILLSTRASEIIHPSIIAAYFLWLEDSIQAKVLEDGTSLASLVRGMQVSSVEGSKYLGIILCFLVFTGLVYFASALMKRRFRWLNTSFQRFHQ